MVVHFLLRIHIPIYHGGSHQDWRCGYRQLVRLIRIHLLAHSFRRIYHLVFCPLVGHHIHQWQHHEQSFQWVPLHLVQQLIRCMGVHQVGPEPIVVSRVNFPHHIGRRKRFLGHLGKPLIPHQRRRLRELDLGLAP